MNCSIFISNGIRKRWSRKLFEKLFLNKSSFWKIERSSWKDCLKPLFWMKESIWPFRDPLDQRHIAILGPLFLRINSRNWLQSLNFSSTVHEIVWCNRWALIWWETTNGTLQDTYQYCWSLSALIVKNQTKSRPKIGCLNFLAKALIRHRRQIVCRLHAAFLQGLLLQYYTATLFKHFETSAQYGIPGC